MRFDRAFATFVLLGFLNPCSSFALTATESTCRDDTARSLARYVGSVGKLLAKCHQRRSTDGFSPDVDCNDAGEADVDARLPRARESLREDIVEACAGSGPLLSTYAECPAPVAGVDDDGPASGIDDFAELATCLAALSDVHVGRLFEDAAGSPPDRLLAPLLKCQKTLAKGVRRIARTILDERRRCQRSADDSGGGPEYSCEGYDARAGIVTKPGEPTRTTATAASAAYPIHVEARAQYSELTAEAAVAYKGNGPDVRRFAALVRQRSTPAARWHSQAHRSACSRRSRT